MEAVLFSNKRTGSTFLQEALDSHPDISAFDEMFMVSTKLTERRGCKLYKTLKEKRGYNIPQYLEWIAGKDNNTIFRLMYNQDNSWSVMPHIMKREMSIIHLKRDPVDIVVSIFCKNKNIQPEDTIHIDKQKFKSLLGQHAKFMNKYTKKLDKYDKMLTLEYKDIFGKTEGDKKNIDLVGAHNIRSEQTTYLRGDVNNRICNFLDVDNIPMCSNITKKFTMPREKKVSNWHELERIISNVER